MGRSCAAAVISIVQCRVGCLFGRGKGRRRGGGGEVAVVGGGSALGPHSSMPVFASNTPRAFDLQARGAECNDRAHDNDNVVVIVIWITT